MNMSEQRLLRLRRLSVVPRWNGVPTLRGQTVDAHCFHVSAIALWLTEFHREANYISRGDLLLYCLLHDEDEGVTGDVPAPAKGIPGLGKALKDFKEARGYYTPSTPDVATIVKCADCLEALVFCLEDQQLGNRTLTRIEEDIREKFRQAWGHFEWDFKTHGSKPPSEYMVDLIWSILDQQEHPVLNEVRYLTHPPEDDSDIPF